MSGPLRPSGDPADLDRYEVEHLFHSWSYQPGKAPARVVSANGCRFTTEDGRERLDFSSCFVSHNIGHGNARVIEAISRQAKEVVSFAPVFSTRPRAQLAKLLADLTPGDLSRTFFSPGGAEANEAAIKICHQYTGRRKLLSRYPSYHGGTAAPMTASQGDPRGWYQMPGGAEVIRVPAPYYYRCPFGSRDPEECAIRCLDYTERVIEMEGGGDHIGGILLEPVIGANGVIVPPPNYLPALRELCDKWGILMICDEVMTGFGRTGKWFAVDHWGVVPDIMTLAKGITSGYVPLGATIARKHIGDYFKDHFFGHGATYAGHALACAAGIETIAVYQDGGLVENARLMGEHLLESARALMDRHPCIGEVRGLGLFVGLELVKSRATREPMVTVADRVKPGPNPKRELAGRLFELGMIAMAANPSSTIALAPPLIVTRDEIDEGIRMLDQALDVVDKYTE